MTLERFASFARTLTVIAAHAAFAACAPTEPSSGLESDVSWEVSVEAIDFEEVIAGTNSPARIVTVRNTSSVELTVGAELAQPSDELVFSLSRAGSRLAPGRSLELSIRFAPPSLGVFESSLRLTGRAGADAEPLEQAVALRGVGAPSPVRADVDRVDFGPVRIGAERARTVRLTNESAQPAVLALGRSTGVAICSPGAAVPFCVDLDSGGFDAGGERELEPGAALDLRLVFAPDAPAGVDRGQLVLTSCPVAAACELRIPLEGRPVERALECDAELDFGDVNPGATVSRDVTCWAAASEEVTITDVRLSNDVARVFGVRGPAESVVRPAEDVGPRESVAIPVSFSPQDLSFSSAGLVVEYTNDTDSGVRAEVPVQGRGGGPDIQIESAELDCGLTSLAVPSQRTVQVRNVGFDPLQIEDVRLRLGSEEVFRVLERPVGALAVGEVDEIVVECAPSREGLLVGILEVVSDDADEPRTALDLRVEGVNVPSCRYEVEGPGSGGTLPFGSVAYGRRVSRTIALRNLSANSPCLVNRVALTPGTDPNFTLPDGELASTLIPPGDARRLRVAYVPTALGRGTGEIEVEVASVSAPFQTVPLTAEAVEEAALVAPNDIDFGRIEAGRSSVPRVVQVFERPGTSFELVSVTPYDPSGAFTVTPTSPLPSDPGFSFQVTYDPPGPSAHVGAVEVVTRIDGRDVRQVVNLEGRAAGSARFVETHPQAGASEVDVLFVIDTSASNNDDQLGMADEFEEFLRLPRAEGIDYRVAVTTTDMVLEAGRQLPRDGTPGARITTERSAPSPELHFRVNIRPGTDGATIEQALAGAEAAFQPTLLLAANRGFRRLGARLAIILQIDENDQSPLSSDYYSAAFEELAGFRRLNDVVVSTISAGPDGCPPPSGYVFPSPDLWTVARRTAGLQVPCEWLNGTQWGVLMEGISKPTFGLQDRFRLSNPAVADSLLVFVDGVEVPRQPQGAEPNWTYDATFEQVVFSEAAIPVAGAEVRFDYVIATQ